MEKLPFELGFKDEQELDVQKEGELHWKNLF